MRILILIFLLTLIGGVCYNLVKKTKEFKGAKRWTRKYVTSAALFAVVVVLIIVAISFLGV